MQWLHRFVAAGLSEGGVMKAESNGVDGLVSDLERLSRLDGAKARLDAETRSVFEDLRAAMPVRTGRLKASGIWSSSMYGEEYEATIEFGGPLAPYAEYVVGPHVNGVHAWDLVVPAHEERIEDAISSAFES